MSPFKKPKLPIYIFTLLGVAASVYNLITDPITPMSAFLAAVAIFFCYQLGVEVSKQHGSIYHRPVTHQIDLDNLIVNKTYYLNGETPAIFLGWDEDTGQTIFHIKGISDPNHLDQGRLVIPSRVKKYFSEYPALTIDN